MAVDAGSIFSEIEIKLNKLDGNIASIESKFDRLGKNLETSAKKATQGFKGAFENFNLAATASVLGVTVAVKTAIGTFAQFEQAIANVGSVANASSSEMQLLENTAREMGASTRFSATQAADALYNLASAGLDATESAAALEGVLNLAGATQSDLAFSSATVTATLSQFGKSADQAGEVANIFAAAISNSQANMDKLSNAMRQVGPVAAGLGRSLEETTGALQILFNAGFQGENAGRALKNALSLLANQTSPTNQKLRQLGVTFDQVNPAVNSLADIFGVLAEAGLETGQVLDAFGQEAGAQILTLINAGREGIIDYTEAVTGTTAATKLYAIQNDTLAGSMDQLKSVSEELAITAGESLEPSLRPLIDIFSGIIKLVTQIPSTIVALITSFGGLAAGILGVVQAASLMGVALPAAFGPVGLILAGVVAAVVGLRTAFVAAKDGADRLSETTKNLSKSTKQYKDISEQLEKGVDKLSGTEQRLLELRRKQLALQIQKQLQELSKTYVQSQKDIENYNKTLERLNAEQDKIVSGARNVRGGFAQQEQALSNLRNRSIEASEKIVEAETNVRESVVSLAEALNAGIISTSQLSFLQRDLAREIINTASAMSEQTSANDALNQSNQAAIAGLEGRADAVKVVLDVERKWRDAVIEQDAAAREKHAQDLIRQGQIEEGFKVRAQLLEEENTREKNILDEKFERRALELENEITNKEILNEALAELEDQKVEEDLARQEFFAGEVVRINREKNNAVEQQEQQHRDALKSVGLQLYSGLKDVVASYFDFKLSSLDKDSEEYKKTAKKQFAIQKAVSAVETAIAGAQAAVNAYKSLSAIPYVGPVLGAVAAAAVVAFTAVKVGFILAKQPGFQTGGIVPGSSVQGDNVLVRANSGEAILNRAQQQRLLDIANGNISPQNASASVLDSRTANVARPDGGSNIMHVTIMLDSKEIYDGIFPASQNGQLKISSRGIIRE